MYGFRRTISIDVLQLSPVVLDIAEAPPSLVHSVSSPMRTLYLLMGINYTYERIPELLIGMLYSYAA